MDNELDGPSTPEALVVEYDPTIREQLIAALARQGYGVAACESLGEGRTRFRRQPLIVAHVNGKSDELQGFIEFVRRESGDDQPYILAIGGLGETTRARAAQFGLNDFLSTPIDEARLRSRLSAISRWLACRAHPESAFLFAEASIEAGSDVSAEVAGESPVSPAEDSFDWKAVVTEPAPPVTGVTPNDVEPLESAEDPQSVAIADPEANAEVEPIAEAEPVADAGPIADTGPVAEAEPIANAGPVAEPPDAPSDARTDLTAASSDDHEPAGEGSAMPSIDAFVEALPMAAAVFDRESRYVASNHRFRHDFGLDPEALAGRTHHEIFPDVHDEWRRLFQHAIEGEAGRIDEDLLRRTDGTSDIVRWDVTPWHDPDGSVCGFLLSQQVITEQKRLERRNRFEDNVTRSLFESTSLPVLLVGFDGRVLRASPAARSLAGLQPTVAGRLRFWEIYPDDDAPAEQTRFEHATARLDESGDFEFTPGDISIAGQPPARLVWTSSPHLNSTGRIEAILFVGALVPGNSARDEPAALDDASAHGDADGASIAVENLACGLVMLNRNGDVVYFNKAVAGLLGVGLDDIEAFEEWLANASPSPGDRDEVLRQWRENVWRRQAVRTFSLITTDGLVKEVEVRPRLTRDGCLLLTLNDVTDQRRAEDALRASEAKFRALFHQSPSPIAVTDHTGAVVDANPSFEKISGIARADLRRTTLESFVEFDPNHDRIDDADATPRAGTTGPPACAILTSRDGCSRPVELHIAPIRNTTGRTFLNACYVQPAGIPAGGDAESPVPISSPAAGDRIADPTPIWRGMAFDAAPVALIVTDLRGRITEANRAATSLTGFARDEIKDTRLYQLFLPDDPDQFSRTISAQIRTAGRWQADTSLTRSDGSTGCCRAQLFPVTQEGAAALLCIIEPGAAETPVPPPVPAAQPLPRSVRHALRNHLQLVGSLLHLEQRKIADPRARAHLEATRQRVGAISLVEEQILRGADPQEIDLPRIIEELSESLRRENSPPVGFHLDPCRLETNLALPLALVANEFLAVALHRLQTATVTVALRVAESAAALDMQWTPSGPASSGDDARFETARLLIDRVGGTLSRDDHGSHWEAVFHFPDQLQSRVHPGEPPNRLGLEPEFPAGTTTGPGPSPF